jgi:hypothetical protein
VRGTRSACAPQPAPTRCTLSKGFNAGGFSQVATLSGVPACASNGGVRVREPSYLHRLLAERQLALVDFAGERVEVFGVVHLRHVFDELRGEGRGTGTNTAPPPTPSVPGQRHQTPDSGGGVGHLLSLASLPPMVRTPRGRGVAAHPGACNACQLHHAWQKRDELRRELLQGLHGLLSRAALRPGAMDGCPTLLSLMAFHSNTMVVLATLLGALCGFACGGKLLTKGMPSANGAQW